MSNTNLNPQIADQLIYTAHSTVTSDRLQLTATDDTSAKVALLDKLGYTIIADPDHTSSFVLVDADDNSIIEVALKSRTFESSLDEAMQASRWELSEPQEFIGGSMGSGFRMDEASV